MSDTGLLREKDPSASNRSRIYDILISTLDTLPLSYRRLVAGRLPRSMVSNFLHTARLEMTICNATGQCSCLTERRSLPKAVVDFQHDATRRINNNICSFILFCERRKTNSVSSPLFFASSQSIRLDLKFHFFRKVV